MIVAFISQLLWLNFAPITTPITTSIFRVPESEVGLLSTVWPLIFIPVSIPAGLLIDKKGFKFGVSVGAIKPSAFSLLFPKQFDVVNFTYILEEVGVSYALRQRLNRSNWE